MSGQCSISLNRQLKNLIYIFLAFGSGAVIFLANPLAKKIIGGNPGTNTIVSKEIETTPDLIVRKNI